MNEKEIFVGSASESRELVERIAQELDYKGFIPRRWWQDFPAGSYTLERLREIAAEVDGAVFIAPGIDLVRSRDSESLAPRDNVILEYGLFVGALGRTRCLLVTDDDCKLPTDCVAITNIRINRDYDSVAEKVASHFFEHFQTAYESERQGAMIIADPELTKFALSCDTYPSSWYQRQLYYGAEGAINWLALSDSVGYLSKDFHLWEHRAVLEHVRQASPRTFVSFGPGDARLDASVMKRLMAVDRTSRYVPVDICEPLLQRAIEKISRFANTPAGIFGDFEEGLAFIHSHVRRLARGPILYSLLGGTLGNFDDSDEEDFLHQMRSLMRRKDHLLLLVSLASDGWSKERDPKCDKSKLDDTFRRFITRGVSKRLQLSPAACLKMFDASVEIVVRPVRPHDGDAHHLIEYYWKCESAMWPLTRICRYSLRGLEADLQAAGFDIQGPVAQWSSGNGSPYSIATLMVRPRHL